MARSWVLAQVLWLAACGRLGFDEARTGADAGMPHAVLDATSIALTSECGVAQPPTAALAIDNDGDGDLVITSATTTGGFTVVTALPLTIAPGASTTLEIAPPVAVIGTDVAGDVVTGTLALVANDPAIPPVGLATEIAGANIAIELNGLPVTTLTFSGLSSCPGPDTLTVHNTGTLPGTIAFTGTSNVEIGGFAGGSLAASGSSTLVATPVTSACMVNGGYILYTVTGSVCTTTPATLAVKINIVGTSACSCS